MYVCTVCIGKAYTGDLLSYMWIRTSFMDDFNAIVMHWNIYVFYHTFKSTHKTTDYVIFEMNM